MSGMFGNLEFGVLEVFRGVYISDIHSRAAGEVTLLAIKGSGYWGRVIGVALLGSGYCTESLQ